jgi:hypothetical protein
MAVTVVSVPNVAMVILMLWTDLNDNLSVSLRGNRADCKQHAETEKKRC